MTQRWPCSSSRAILRAGLATLPISEEAEGIFFCVPTHFGIHGPQNVKRPLPLKLLCPASGISGAGPRSLGLQRPVPGLAVSECPPEVWGLWPQILEEARQPRGLCRSGLTPCCPRGDEVAPRPMCTACL